MDIQKNGSAGRFGYTAKTAQQSTLTTAGICARIDGNRCQLCLGSSQKAKVFQNTTTGHQVQMLTTRCQS